LVFNARRRQPTWNWGPCYAGGLDARSVSYKYGAAGGREKGGQFVRSAMYGSFLSGGLAGHVYGAEGIWGGDIEPKAPVKMWDAFRWNSAAQMRHLRTFAFSIGKRYQDLVPNADLVSPNKTAAVKSYEGWAYCARTADKKIFLIYFEQGCPRSEVRSAKLGTVYRAEWFDPRTGAWQPAATGILRSSVIGTIALPEPPADADWGLKLQSE